MAACLIRGSRPTSQYCALPSSPENTKARSHPFPLLAASRRQRVLTRVPSGSCSLFSQAEAAGSPRCATCTHAHCFLRAPCLSLPCQRHLHAGDNLEKHFCLRNAKGHLTNSLTGFFLFLIPLPWLPCGLSCSGCRGTYPRGARRSGTVIMCVCIIRMYVCTCVCMYTHRLALSQARMLNALLVGCAEAADEEAWKGVETETGLDAAAWRCRCTESDARCALCCWLLAPTYLLWRRHASLLAAGAARVYDMRYDARVWQNSREI
jgi:hypothetical protein